MQIQNELPISSWIIYVLIQLVGVSAAAYLGAHYRKKGEIHAVTAAIDEVKAAKEALTYVAEKVKTGFAANEWDRQWLRNERLKVYTEITDLLNTFMKLLPDMRRALHANDHARVREVYERELMLERILDLRTMVEIIGSPNVRELYIKNITELANGLALTMTTGPLLWPSAFDNLYQKLRSSREATLEAIRGDFGNEGQAQRSS